MRREFVALHAGDGCGQGRSVLRSVRFARDVIATTLTLHAITTTIEKPASPPTRCASPFCYPVHEQLSTQEGIQKKHPSRQLGGRTDRKLCHSLTRCLRSKRAPTC